MSIFGKLFGGEEAAKSVVKTSLQLIDDAFYTKAEKESDHLKERIQVAKSVQTWLENSGGPNLARRVIAIGIFAMWFSMLLASMVIHIASIFVDDAVTRAVMDEVSDDTRGFAADISIEMMLVLGYYFAAPQVDKFAAPLVQKAMNMVGKK